MARPEAGPPPADRSRAWDRLVWGGDRLLFDGQAFRLEGVGGPPLREPGDLRFFKSREFVERLGTFFARRPEFRPRRILEMGIWEGGSIAFWNQVFSPEQHVAFDLADRGDSEEFLAWRLSNDRRGSIETVWGVDQSDRRAVLDLVRRTFDGPLDLVIDDAAHIVECLRPAFETLFPLLQPGGLYLIEDWSWSHRAEYQAEDHFWRPYGSPTQLVHEIVASLGSGGDLLAAVHLDPDWIAIERGTREISSPLDFRLADHILRRPEP